MVRPGPFGFKVVDVGRLPADARLFLDAPKRTESTKCQDLLSFFFAQDVCHCSARAQLLRRRQRPELSASLAGFQVSTTGRIWVSAKV